MADRERPTYLIFLTDGLPTEGVVDSAADPGQFPAKRARRTCACSPLAWATMWTPSCWTRWPRSTTAPSTYVLPGERLDETLSAFYAKISTPVLTDLAAGFRRAAGLRPVPLPAAGPVRRLADRAWWGATARAGEADVTLSGEVNGAGADLRVSQTRFSPERSQPAAAGSASPRLWATRKIGYLLNQVRLQRRQTRRPSTRSCA